MSPVVLKQPTMDLIVSSVKLNLASIGLVVKALISFPKEVDQREMTSHWRREQYELE